MLPRPYQKRLVDKAESALARHGNTLAVAATGAGKTIMLAMLAQRIGGKTLILQHRQELVQQNMAKYRQINSGVSCSLFTADAKSFRGDATFAMVQSLAGHVDRIPRFNLVIADEAHHCAAPTWQRILDAVREKNPGVLVAGFTATPSRSDRRTLRKTFDNVCDQITIKELVALGFLVPPKAFVISVGDTQDALTALGPVSDFGEQTAVEAILNTTAVTSEIIRHWRDKAAGRPTIIFASTVNHAKDVAQAFNTAGIPAGIVHGSMSDGERRAVLRRLSTGEISVLTNVMVLTEGFDFPPVSCVILLRRCSDKGPLIQMAGRGLRTVDPELYPGVVKKDCLILDFGTSILTHGDLSASVELGEDEEDVCLEDKVSKTKICPEDYEQASGEIRFPDSNGAKGCGAELPIQTRTCPFCGFRFEHLGDETQVQRVELTEMNILDASPFRYVDLFGNDRCLIAAGFTAWAGVFSTDGENWFALGKSDSTTSIRKVLVGGRLQAIAAADDFLRAYETESNAKKSKRWLDEPATERQLDLLGRFGYRLGCDVLGNSGLTKYGASCHTAFQFNRSKIETALGVR